MLRKKYLYQFVCAVLLGLLLIGCAPAAPASTSGDAATDSESMATESTDAMADTLVIAISEDTASLDPARAFETLPSIVHKATYQTLVTFPADSVEQVAPSLAASWEISDDGTVYTFTLDGNAAFSTGDPVTADDVVFSL